MKEKIVRIDNMPYIRNGGKSDNGKIKFDTLNPNLNILERMAVGINMD